MFLRAFAECWQLGWAGFAFGSCSCYNDARCDVGRWDEQRKDYQRQSIPNHNTIHVRIFSSCMANNSICPSLAPKTALKRAVNFYYTPGRVNKVNTPINSISSGIQQNLPSSCSIIKIINLTMDMMVYSLIISPTVWYRPYRQIYTHHYTHVANHQADHYSRPSAPHTHTHTSHHHKTGSPEHRTITVEVNSSLSQQHDNQGY